MSERAKITLTAALAMVAAAALIFYLFRAGVWFAVGVHPEVMAALEHSLEDQRQLAEQDPAAEEAYRQRFETTGTLLQRLRIVEHNRERIARRYQQALLLVFAGAAILITGASVVRQSRREGRLRRLQGALAELVRGRTDVVVGERRGDLIGRIAAMIERTSRVMARDRRRLAALENLSAWQEAARRHAHEMRTPLTGARLELGRLNGLLQRETLRSAEEVRQAAQSAAQELERLGRFASAFTSFGRLPRPRPALCDLSALVGEFAATFEAAWPNLELVVEAGSPPEELSVKADRDLLRQVLVNLCDNSSLALDGRPGRVRFTLGRNPERRTADAILLDVADDGPGIDEAIRGRLFEPYTTSRGVGEGMGLGLAISKKILLDHGGDLELVRSSAAGTTFRLTLPAPAPARDAPARPNPPPSPPLPQILMEMEE